MLYFIILVVYIIVDLIFADYMKNVAYAKGYDDNAHAFAICFWFGPVGCLYVVALPDLVARKNQEEIIALLSKSGTVVDELPEL